MTDHDDDAMRRRLFQNFQKRVFGRTVHQFGAVDDDHLVAALARRQVREVDGMAHILDPDLGRQLAAVVDLALDRHQVAVAALIEHGLRSS